LLLGGGLVGRDAGDVEDVIPGGHVEPFGGPLAFLEHVGGLGLLPGLDLDVIEVVGLGPAESRECAGPGAGQELVEGSCRSPREAGELRPLTSFESAVSLRSAIVGVSTHARVHGALGRISHTVVLINILYKRSFGVVKFRAVGGARQPASVSVPRETSASPTPLRRKTRIISRRRGAHSGGKTKYNYPIAKRL